jgi:hypothetical protein
MSRRLAVLVGLTVMLGPAQALAAEPFPAVAGWVRSAKVQVFEPDHLYDYINGASELYLAYGFQELRVAEYAGADKAVLTVEVYAHQNPRQAFGIYSQERLSDVVLIPGGAEAYLDPEQDFAGLVKGDHYVKFVGHKLGPDKGRVLREFVAQTAANLEGAESLPPLLASLPEENRVKNSELYVDVNFLGYGFFRAAYSAEYDLAGQRAKAFIMEAADETAAQAMLRDYLIKLGRKAGQPGRLDLADPNHGPITLEIRGRYLAGVLNLIDPAQRDKQLDQILERLPR